MTRIGIIGDGNVGAALARGLERAGKSRKQVIELARGIGFDPVDAGPLRNARLIEPLAYLNIQLAYVLGMGAQIGFGLLRG